MNCEPGVEVSFNKAGTAQRHSAIVRITHWIVVLSVLGLLVSGLRLGRHLGFKNTKYLSRIIVTDNIDFKGRVTWYGGI